jgi:alanine racemase
MLYGADPLMKTDTSLRAVMQLTSNNHRNSTYSSRRVYRLWQHVYSNARYNRRRVVACGYADGYPRSASNLAPAAVDGQMTKLIGRVSMDMLFVDLTDIVDANGFPKRQKWALRVELWGDQVPANDVAKAANTIAYELFCNVKRVQFKYTDQ